MRILTRGIHLIFAIIFFCIANAQSPEQVYKKPLTEVLVTIEKKYNVKLKYDDRTVKNLNVNYATWRFTSDIKTTLDNILRPLDLIYREAGNNTYEITQYDYYRRSEAEGKKHLDELLVAYSNANAFDKRKKELRECISNALGITTNAHRTALNPIFSKKIVMNGYTVENVAFESIPGYFVTGTLYRPLNAKGPSPVILNPHGH